MNTTELAEKVEEYLKLRGLSAERTAKLRTLLTTPTVQELMLFLLYLQEKTEQEDPILAAARACPIESLGLSQRTYNALTGQFVSPQKRLVTVADLLEKSDRELSLYRNIGQKSLEELRRKRAEYLERWNRR